MARGGRPERTRGWARVGRAARRAALGAALGSLALAPAAGGARAAGPAVEARAARPKVAQVDDPWFRAGQRRLADVRARPRPGARARNAILFIGDGMGVATVTAARILDGQNRGRPGEENALSFERFPVVALVKTYNTDQQVPDSAGAATALLSGVKTRAGVVGLDSGAPRGECAASRGHEVTTLLELADRAGLATGVVTTTRITHATPAAAYGHTPERNWESDGDLPPAARKAGCADLARQLVELGAGDGIDVALGGGRAAFLPAGGAGPAAGLRHDGRDLVREWLGGRPRSAYVATRADLLAVSPGRIDRLLGLFAPSHLAYEADRDRAVEPSLSEMTGKAIDILSRHSKGFLLVVEGGRIDHAHHDGDARRALIETIELAHAVGLAARRTSPRDTLIVVTADHGHTLSISGYPVRGNPILGLVVSNVPGAQTGEPALASDGLPYTTLGYANGPGAPLRTPRRDLSKTSTDAPGFRQPAMVPLPMETHDGADVALYARGPGAELLSGVVEQNFVFHALAAATGLLGGAR